MRATVQRRSSLPDPFNLGTPGKGREARGRRAPGARRAGSMSGQALVGACACPMATTILTRSSAL